jgi:hypothetical protein
MRIVTLMEYIRCLQSIERLVESKSITYHPVRAIKVNGRIWLADFNSPKVVKMLVRYEIISKNLSNGKKLYDYRNEWPWQISRSLG